MSISFSCQISYQCLRFPNLFCAKVHLKQLRCWRMAAWYFSRKLCDKRRMSLARPWEQWVISVLDTNSFVTVLKEVFEMVITYLWVQNIFPLSSASSPSCRHDPSLLSSCSSKHGHCSSDFTVEAKWKCLSQDDLRPNGYPGLLILLFRTLGSPSHRLDASGWCQWQPVTALLEIIIFLILGHESLSSESTAKINSISFYNFVSLPTGRVCLFDLKFLFSILHTNYSFYSIHSSCSSHLPPTQPPSTPQKG